MRAVVAAAGLVLLLAGAGPVRGQAVGPEGSAYRTRTTDSLWALLRQPRAALPDTQRALTLFSLEQEYHLNDNRQARRVALQGLAYARQIRFLRGEYMILSDLSRIASGLEDLPQAARWAQELQQRTDQAPPLLHRFRAVALQTLASVANAQGDQARSVLLMRQALVLLQGLPRPWPYLEMLSYYGLSSDYADRVTEVARPPDSLIRQALRYVRRFATLARAQHRPDLLAQSYTMLALIEDRLPGQRFADSAAAHLQQSLKLARLTGLQDYEFNTLLKWSQVAMRHGQYAAAAMQARAALVVAQQIQNIQKEGIAYTQLAEALAAQNEGIQAYQSLQLARKLEDSVAQLNNRTALRKLQVRYQTERKENQIQQLTQRQKAQQAEAARQQQRVWALSAVLVAVLAGLAVAALLYSRLRRSRAQLAAQNAQLARQRDELTQTRATQDRLYALIAHDLRSPVVAFTGLADLLNRYVSKGDTVRLAGLGGRIRQAAQSLHALLDNLLNWAISQRGELTPRPQPLRATDLLAELADLYQPAAAAADVALRVEAPAPDLLLHADPDMTRTILRNLAGNALKATPAGGTVVLRAERTAHGARMQVTDSGAGFSAEELVRLNGTVSTLRVAGHTGGAGLGLLLSRAFAETQGGSLVLGAAPAGGAEATLILPLAH